MAELSIVDGVFNLKVTQGTTSRFANGVDEESVEAAILVETNARIAGDVYARPYPPTAPVEGKLWLRTVDDVKAVVDFRAYADGEPSLGDPDSTDWDDIERVIADPTFIGSNTNAKLIDFSGEFSGAYTANTPSVTSGVMLSPTVAQSTIHTVAGIALTELRADDGPLTTTVHRFTIGVDDLRVPSTDDEDDITRAIHRVGVFGYGGVGSASNGPCVEVRVDWVGADPVCRINAAWATPTEIDPSGSTPTSIGRLLERGDRVTCAVDFVNNQWWAELNGEEVDGTRMGANTDFDTISDLNDGVDTFIEQYKMMLFSAGSGADNWESGVIWASYTLYDYAPNRVTMFKYDGDAEAWVPEITPAIAGSQTSTSGGGGGGTGKSGANFTVTLIGQWNSPVLDGLIPEPNLSLMTLMEDISPVPSGPVHIEADYAVGDPTPLAPPTFGDVPASSAWISAQDIADADIYGVFYVPIAYAPPEIVGAPVWFRLRMTDADGFVSYCYAYIADGLPVTAAEVDMHLVTEAEVHPMTVAAAPSPTGEGDATDYTVTVAAEATTIPAALIYVDARLDALGGAPSGAAGGDLSGTYPNPTIGTGAVTNTMLAGSIALSKLATDPLARANHTGTQTLSTISDAGTLAGLNAIASSNITDGTIVDADINASAAIAQSKVASLTTDLAAKAATSALVYPKRHSIPCSVSPPNTYTTWTPTVSGVTYGGYAAGAGTETWTYELVMMAGTWSIRWVYRKTSSGGIITAVLAGVSLTTVDTYNAGNAEASASENGITVATSGYQSLVLTNPTKHGSSGGYGFTIHGIELTRTGP